MDNIADKNKRFVFLYEFLGTAMLVMGQNMAPGCTPWILLAVSIWSWEIGVAHFNYAISIGSMVFKYVKTRSNPKNV